MENKVEYCENGYLKIYAKPALNPTGIRLEKGKKYYFKTSGKWQDSEKLPPCDGDGFDRWYLYPVFYLRTYKTAPWFCLIGEVDGELIRMGKEGSFTAPKSGMLGCFANDAPKHRDNNIGHICLKVQEEPF